MSEKIKIRITSTMVREIEVDPNWYSEGKRTPEDIIAFECNAAECDPHYFLECEEVTVTGEVVNG